MDYQTPASPTETYDAPQTYDEIQMPQIPNYGSATTLTDFINSRIRDSAYRLGPEEAQALSDAWYNLIAAIDQAVSYPLDKDDVHMLSSICDYIDSLKKEQLTLDDIDGIMMIISDRTHVPTETVPGRYVERKKDDMTVLRFIPDGYFDDFTDDELIGMHIKIFNTLLLTPAKQRRAAYDSLTN